MAPPQTVGIPVPALHQYVLQFDIPVFLCPVNSFVCTQGLTLPLQVVVIVVMHKHLLKKVQKQGEKVYTQY